MAWRIARSLDTLLAEINQRSPNRDKASDGGIGNAEHATRASDHNPWVKDRGVGIVTARDFDNDPDSGFDSSSFAEWLRKRCKAGTEKRVKYIISDRRIASEIGSWTWRKYSGPNAHLSHVHISVLPIKARYDNTAAWGWYSPAPKPDPKELDVDEKILRKIVAEESAKAAEKAVLKVLTSAKIVPNVPTEAQLTADPKLKTTYWAIAGLLANLEKQGDDDSDRAKLIAAEIDKIAKAQKVSAVAHEDEAAATP